MEIEFFIFRVLAEENGKHRQSSKPNWQKSEPRVCRMQETRDEVYTEIGKEWMKEGVVGVYLSGKCTLKLVGVDEEEGCSRFIFVASARRNWVIVVVSFWRRLEKRLSNFGGKVKQQTIYKNYQQKQKHYVA